MGHRRRQRAPRFLRGARRRHLIERHPRDAGELPALDRRPRLPHCARRDLLRAALRRLPQGRALPHLRRDASRLPPARDRPQRDDERRRVLALEAAHRGHLRQRLCAHRVEWLRGAGDLAALRAEAADERRPDHEAGALPVQRRRLLAGADPPAPRAPAFQGPSPAQSLGSEVPHRPDQRDDRRLHRLRAVLCPPARQRQPLPRLPGDREHALRPRL